jgi:NADH-quinone oxidoreductase subunit M
VNVLSLIVFLPLAAAVVLLALPRLGDEVARWVWVAVAAVDLALVVGLWTRYETPPAGGLAFEEQVAWIPGVSSSYHVGVDGISLPLVAMTALIFLACAVYALREQDRPRIQAALFLFLQTVSLGLFVSADLILFYVFFDLSIVGMYYVIAGWGHGDAGRSAMKFFLYTVLGSLALLAGFIGLYVAAEPHTFDMVELAAAAPLAGSSVSGGLVLAAILVGLAVKTPTVPCRCGDGLRGREHGLPGIERCGSAVALETLGRLER